MAKPLLLGKTIKFFNWTFPYWQQLSISWQNLYFLAKPLNFLIEPFPIGNTCLLHGKTFTSWENH